MHLLAAHSPSTKTRETLGSKRRLKGEGGEGKKKGRKLRGTTLSLEDKFGGITVDLLKCI